MCVADGFSLARRKRACFFGFGEGVERSGPESAHPRNERANCGATRLRSVLVAHHQPRHRAALRHQGLGVPEGGLQQRLEGETDEEGDVGRKPR